MCVADSELTTYVCWWSRGLDGWVTGVPVSAADVDYEYVSLTVTRIPSLSTSSRSGFGHDRLQEEEPYRVNGYGVGCDCMLFTVTKILSLSCWSRLGYDPGWVGGSLALRDKAVSGEYVKVRCGCTLLIVTSIPSLSTCLDPEHNDNKWAYG